MKASRFNRVGRFIRHHGVMRTAQLVAGRLAHAAFKGPLRAYISPKLSDFEEISELHVLSAESVVRHLWPEAPLDDLAAEFAGVAQDLEDRYAQADLKYLRRKGMEEEATKLLYYMTRILQPERTVETGVANGHSTYALLRAIQANGAGRLHSVDVDPDVGQLVPESLRSGWQLHVIDPAKPEEGLRRILSSNAPINLFLRDSDHRYLQMLFEFQEASRHLAHDGWLVTDDADTTHAFIDFCDRAGVQPVILVEARKVAGLVQPRR